MGLIAASAIACADSLTALLPLAVEAVRVAFRVGAHVGNVSDRLETRRNAPKSWSTMLSAESEESVKSELETFHEQNVSANQNSELARVDILQGNSCFKPRLGKCGVSHLCCYQWSAFRPKTVV